MKRFFCFIITMCVFFACIGSIAQAKRFERKKRTAGSKKNLTCELKVEPEKGSCRLTLTVKNPNKKEVVLKSETSQKYDFLIKDKKGNEIWQWSAGQKFTQMVADVTIAAGGELAFTEKWDYKDKDGKKVVPGKYKVQGVVAITPKPLMSKWIDFEIAKTMISDKPDPIKGKVTKIKDNWYVLADDGKAYSLPNPPPLLTALEGREITVTSYKLKPIPGTEDVELRIGAFVN